MTNRFDHFMYAGRDLEPMCSAFEALTGVKPDPGGRHPGQGTRNALASLGADIYLELIATDPEQPLVDNMGSRIQAFATSRLFNFVMRADDVDAAQRTLARHAIESDLFDASRQTPDGSTLRWRLLVPRVNRFGEFVPRFIDWLGTTHPATTSTKGCHFESYEMAHPQADALGALFRDLDAEVDVRRAEQPCHRLTIATPRGAVVLQSES